MTTTQYGHLVPWERMEHTMNGTARPIITDQGPAKITYEVDPPIAYRPDWDGPEHHTRYVWVSSANIPMLGVFETYIFPANRNGDVLDWGELDGSSKGTASHAEVLGHAGYDIVEPKNEVTARPQPELEEFGNGWVGCSTCNVQQPTTAGVDTFIWWKAHLYEHLKGVRP